MLKLPSMLYSKSAEYAIQAMIYLAERKSDKPIMIHSIAKEYGIPAQFLSKIMQTLVKQRLIKATRGRKGGINLAKPASMIYLHQIVYAIDGLPPEKEQCVIGLDLCADDTPCPLHEQWKPIRHQLRQLLESEPLDDLAKRVLEKRQRMNN